MNYDKFDVDDDDIAGTISSLNSGLRGTRLCIDGETTPIMGVKRKATISPPSSTMKGSDNQIEAGLAFIKSSLKSAMNEARLGRDKFN